MIALGLTALLALAASSQAATASPAPPKAGAATKESLELEKARLELEQARAKANEAQALVFKAEAEKEKAEAEAARARADAGRPTSEYLKADFERIKYFVDLAFHAVLLVVAVGFVKWALPKLSEFTVSIFGGTLIAKLGEKLPPVPPPPSLTSASAPGRETQALLDAAGRTAQPVPETLLDLAEEDDVYKAVRVERHTIYLSHRAKRVPRTEYSRIEMYLDADEPAALEKVECVKYRLHPTFTPREVTVERGKGPFSEKGAFSHEVTAWGEFMLYASVYFKGQTRPILLTRYLNL